METVITQQEINDLYAFFKAHHIAWIGAEGDKNGETFGNYFDLWASQSANKQTIPFTPQALEVAFKKLKESGSLYFYSPDETQYHLYEEQLGPEASEIIRRFLPTYTLSNEGEGLFMNFNSIASYCIRTGQPITPGNLRDRVIGNVRNQPGTRLHWSDKRPLQDWEKERIRKRQAEEEAREHYEDYHRKNNPEYQEEQRLKQQQETLKKDNDSYWEQRTRSFIASIKSHVQQAEAQQLFGSKQMNGNWEVNYRSLENWFNRKKAENPGLWV